MVVVVVVEAENALSPIKALSKIHNVIEMLPQRTRVDTTLCAIDSFNHKNNIVYFFSGGFFLLIKLEFFLIY